eukprot:gnl/MRDRNA2_/MRDRNA2_86686_c0_seq2.p1 gnl/MRDRNA2_/MRDRNA2_86686_c0~~gnl/MRDRNA2_/MRDRNA2_86686_c0_seq2.p1  ORF type:complete len:881 (+),score=121.95 gnl/MRDRNA2_/MRDRNA2_86686_c0_seq2:91-2733(+)
MSGCPVLSQQSRQNVEQLGRGTAGGCQGIQNRQSKSKGCSAGSPYSGASSHGRQSSPKTTRAVNQPNPTAPGTWNQEPPPPPQTCNKSNLQQSTSDFVFLGPSSIRPYVREVFESFCREILPGWVIDTSLSQNNDLIEGSVAKLVHVLSTSMRANKRMLINSLTNACVVTDYRGYITSYNNAAELAFGWTRDEVIGANIKLLIADAHVRKNHDFWLQQYHRKKESKIIGYSDKAVPARQMKGLRKDGSEFSLMLGVSEIQFHEGEPSFVASITDIQELHEKRQQAEHMSKDLKNLTQNLWGFFTAIFDATCEVRTDGKNAKVMESSPQWDDFGQKYLNVSSMEGADLIDMVPPDERARFKQYLSSFVTPGSDPPMQTVAPKISTYLSNPDHGCQRIKAEIFAMRIESGSSGPSCSDDVGYTCLRLGFRLLTDIQVRVPNLVDEEEHGDFKQQGDDLSHDDFIRHPSFDKCTLPTNKSQRTEVPWCPDAAVRTHKKEMHPCMSPDSMRSSHSRADDERVSLHSELHSLPENETAIVSLGSLSPEIHSFWRKGRPETCSSSSSDQGFTGITFGLSGFYQQGSMVGLAQLDTESIVDGAGFQSNDHTSAPTVSALSESDSMMHSESNTCGDKESSELESNQLIMKPDSLSDPLFAQRAVSAKESMMLMRRCLSDVDFCACLNRGSNGHPDMCRKPCKYFWLGGCQNGEQCSFCHLPHTMHSPRLDKKHRHSLEKLEPSSLYEIFGHIMCLKAAKYRCGTQMSQIFQDLHARALAGKTAISNSTTHRPNRRMLGVLESMSLGHLLHKLMALLQKQLSPEEQNIQLPKLRACIQACEDFVDKSSDEAAMRKKLKFQRVRSTNSDYGVAGKDQKQSQDDTLSTVSI